MGDVIHLDFRANRLLRELESDLYAEQSALLQVRAARSLLEIADGLRQQVAECEAAALLTGPRQLTRVDEIASRVAQGSVALDELVDQLMCGAPSNPLGAKRF